MEKTKQSSKECLKLSDGKPINMPSIDRLSALPNDILCRILSFLPTKFSMATSILARRWRFLWAHVPNIEFIEDYETKLLHDGGSFFDIINRVMLQYEVQSMNTLGLHMNYCDENQFETSINSVIARNVKNLDLSFHESCFLPSCIFTCKTLVDLRVACEYIRMNNSGTVYLPALKKFHLEFAWYDEFDESLPHLLSGCPVLEELIVNRFVMDEPDMLCCYISSPTIKTLILNSKFHSPFVPPYAEAYRLKIDTPALRYLLVHDAVSEVVTTGPLASLTEADVVLYGDEPIEGSDLYSRSVIVFVGRLCNVKCLNLSSGRMKVPDSTFSALNIKFHNLTKLELAADWRFLSYFLGNADNLEVLIIHKVDVDLQWWMEPLQVPKCLLSHLRSVRIDQMGCTEHEFNMVGYLLRNAQVLERMKIIFSQHDGIDLKAKSDALKRVSLFEQGSKACELVFH